MIFKHPSILRNLLFSFLALGLGMGSVFPVYAKFFVEWKPGMFTWFVMGCLVAGATIGLANYAVVKLVLLGKLKRISAVAHAISEKDISLKCEMQSKDVVGEIIDSFNVMASNLREIITRINDQATQVSHSTDELHQITLDMSNAASRQYSETDQVATAINEMTATVQEVSRHASETAMTTSEADAQGVKAKQVIGSAKAAVEALANNVSVANGVILRLQEESRNIGSVLSVISGIAEQTNLLALNAAIEAARAGEQGRGFAVVADEVRGLANRTQESTREISDMIDRLQKETGSAVHAMEQGSQQALKGVELSNDGRRPWMMS